MRQRIRGRRAVIIHLVSKGIDTIWYAGDGRAGQSFSIGQQAAGIVVCLLKAVQGDDLLHALLANAVGCHLGCQDAPALLRRAYIASDDFQCRVVGLPGFDQFDWG